MYRRMEQWRTEILTMLSRIPSSVVNTSVKTWSEYSFTHLQIEWNPWLGGYRPQIPVLSPFCAQLNLLNPPTWKKNCWRNPSSEQGSLQAGRRYTSQTAFQVWPPKSGIYLLFVLRAYWCPEHVEAIKVHTLSHLVGSLLSRCLRCRVT
jgi:hypothetical protein